MSAEGPFGRAPDEGQARRREKGSGTFDSAGAESVRPAPFPPPRPPRTISTTSWVAGVAIVLLLAVVTINSIRTEGTSAEGLEVGAPLPVFTAPLATANVPEDTDANVAIKATKDIKTAACDVKRPDVVNVCEMRDRGPVALVFTVTESEDCEKQVDLIDRIRGRFPDVQFAAIAIKGDRDELRKVIRERGWTLPVAYDHDGVVANIYGVAICPTITFAGSDGRVAGTSLGLKGEAEIARRLEALE